MFRKAIDEAGTDAGASYRPEISWRDRLVCPALKLYSLPTYSFFSRPNAKRVVSPADRELMEQHGAAVVECSWVRVKEVPWSRIGGKCERLRMYLARYGFD